jgi:hypothetical protein
MGGSQWRRQELVAGYSFPLSFAPQEKKSGKPVDLAPQDFFFAAVVLSLRKSEEIKRNWCIRG